ncbi:hypothetical protein lbkm_4125 [Lachnospiraceae bacterium KM106-2]|nr:hypothetical protein lbkm_4125 [Lachnospiraceae bacterium KM106-2]
MIKQFMKISVIFTSCMVLSGLSVCGTVKAEEKNSDEVIEAFARSNIQYAQDSEDDAVVAYLPQSTRLE